MIETDTDFTGRTVIVELGTQSYPIFVGSETLSQFGKLFLRHCGRGGGGVVIITDDNVGPLYSRSVSRSLADVDVKSQVITVAAGEASKRMSVVETIYDKLFDFALERSGAIVALGGGVVGDLAGFVAATFKRGVSYVQLPSSLLAMVDSSIGGKTGINHPRGKNMIGAFYQPKMVFADTAVLKTLPRRELGCGLAETVKHSVIRDGEFFEHLVNHADRIKELQQELMIDLVVRNCRIKAAVVSADERESGLRGILNYGHTIGHAMETVFADRDIHHGEAVSLGMVAAGRMAEQRGLLEAASVERIIKLLHSFNLPTTVKESLPTDELPAYAGPDSARGDSGSVSILPILPEITNSYTIELYRAMQHDKKVRAGKIRFVLPTSLGSCTFVDDLTEEEIKTAIRQL